MHRKATIDEIAENIRNNDYGQWGKGRNSTEPGTKPGHASRRLGEDIIELRIRNSVTLPEDPKVFAMGSCFAREIEACLFRRGFDILSMPRDMLTDPDFQDKESGKFQRGLSNRFNTPSMELEFRHLLSPDKVIGDDQLIVKMRDESYLDAHYFGDFPLASPEAVAERRAKYRNYFRGLMDADIIVMTLGLAEACYDVPSGLYRNMSPQIFEIRRRAPLEVHMVDFTQNLQSLMNIWELVTKYSRVKPIFVVTVSPVPLTMTYFEDDVIILNSEAKSTLRAAAAHFVGTVPNAIYFPSYELVTLSARRKAYRGDMRHVQARFVDHIMQTFVDAFELKTNATRAAWAETIEFAPEQ